MLLDGKQRELIHWSLTLGKRSNFARKKNDFYPTPYKAILPLLSELPIETKYIEPCCGEDDLINHLSLHDHICVGKSDLPDDARTMEYNVAGADCFITNPPWSRDLLHPIINNLRVQLPTWLLFDAGWMHTKQAREFLLYCNKIISVGRLKWISDSKYGSLDDSCWYRFHKHPTDTQFINR